MIMQHDITSLLIEWNSGNKKVPEAIFPLVYEQLKLIAGSQLLDEHRDLTLQRTELVHEAFLKMVDQTRISATDKQHFYNIAARCMRQILVDHARKKLADKRGGAHPHVPLDDNMVFEEPALEHVLHIDSALKDLMELDERMTQVVELHFFGGLSISETAEVMNISTSTVDREWKKAKLWLFKTLQSDL